MLHGTVDTLCTKRDERIIRIEPEQLQQQTVAVPATSWTPPGDGGSFHAADFGRLIRMLKTLYLANPYGFSAQQRAGPLVALVDALTAPDAPR